MMTVTTLSDSISFIWHIGSNPPKNQNETLQAKIKQNYHELIAFRKHSVGSVVMVIICICDSYKKIVSNVKNLLVDYLKMWKLLRHTCNIISVTITIPLSIRIYILISITSYSTASSIILSALLHFTTLLNIYFYYIIL